MASNLISNGTTISTGSSILYPASPNENFNLSISATSDYFVNIDLQQSADNVTFTTIKSWNVKSTKPYSDSFAVDVPSNYYVRSNITAISGSPTINLTSSQLINRYPITVSTDAINRPILSTSPTNVYSKLKTAIERASGKNPFDIPITAVYTASIAAGTNQLVVSAITSGEIVAGDYVSSSSTTANAGVRARTRILSQVSGTDGGVGTYKVSTTSTAGVPSTNFANFSVTTALPDVTITNTALSNSKTIGYSPATADYFSAIGLPFKDGSLCYDNSSGGNVQFYGVSGLSGTDVYGLNRNNTYLVGGGFAVRVTCQQFQFSYWDRGGTAGITIYVNGVPVQPEVIGNNVAGFGTGRLQLDFPVRDTYDIFISSEFNYVFGSITIGENDTLHVINDYKLPIPFYGDSYHQGTTSPYVKGSPAIPNALALIGGINPICANCTVGTGLLNATAPVATDARRLNYMVDIVNAANAPLTAVAFGYNDVGAAPTAQAVQDALTIVLNALLSRTKTNIAVFGCAGGIRNLSAAMVTYDTGLKNAIAALPIDYQARVGFVDVNNTSEPWVYGTRSTGAPAGGVAGNSRYIIGTDTIHPSPAFTQVPAVMANLDPNSGVEYYARMELQALLALAYQKAW